MQDQRKQIVDRCNELFALAEQKYGVSMKGVDIRFDLKGRCAGTAHRRGGHYFIRFNQDMLSREAFDHVLKDTVPHEIAHIVCFKSPQLGHNHDSGWARVCRALGGSGQRTHSEEVIYGKGHTYEYTTSTGKKVRVGDLYHRRIQSGSVLRWRNNYGTADAYCQFSIVGYQGRTLPNPRHFPGKPRPGAAQTANPVAEQVTLKVADPMNLLGGNDTVKIDLPTIKPVPPAPTVPRILLSGESKASISRRLMQYGYNNGESYETIIAAMMAANGYDRQLARATFKANAAKVGIPANWGG